MRLWTGRVKINPFGVPILSATSNDPWPWFQVDKPMPGHSIEELEEHHLEPWLAQVVEAHPKLPHQVES